MNFNNASNKSRLSSLSNEEIGESNEKNYEVGETIVRFYRKI